MNWETQGTTQPSKQAAHYSAAQGHAATCPRCAARRALPAQRSPSRAARAATGQLSAARRAQSQAERTEHSRREPQLTVPQGRTANQRAQPRTGRRTSYMHTRDPNGKATAIAPGSFFLWAQCVQRRPRTSCGQPLPRRWRQVAEERSAPTQSMRGNRFVRGQRRRLVRGGSQSALQSLIQLASRWMGTLFRSCLGSGGSFPQWACVRHGLHPCFTESAATEMLEGTSWVMAES